MIINNLNDLPDKFKEGYRGVMLLKRTKDGGDGNADRRAFKKITSSKEEWTETIKEFLKMRIMMYPEHRIYSSVNSRDMTKAIREFKRRQLDTDYDSYINDFYCDVKNRFFSCFMNPLAKKDKFFLIDCDTPEEFELTLNVIPNELILYIYPTKNGNHVITKAFDIKEYENFGLNIKRDDLIYIG